MSVNWIPFYHDTLRKRQIDAIANILGISYAEALFACLKLWVWADEQCVTLSSRCRVTKKFLDAQVGLSGFCCAYESVGWLREYDNGILFIKLGNKQSQTLKQRLLTRERQRKYRNENVTPDRDKNVTRKTKRKRSNKTTTYAQPAHGPFEQFWAAWPKGGRKGSPAYPRQIWKRKQLDAKGERILQALDVYKSCEQWTKDNGQFIPTPGKWLNHESWDCDLEDLTMETEVLPEWAAPDRNPTEEEIAMIEGKDADNQPSPE